MTENVFNIIEKNEAEYKDLLRDMVTLPSYTYDKADVDKLSDFIKAFSESKGFSVKVYPFEKAGNGLVISMNEGSPLPAIVFTAHMDTVHKRGKWPEPLFREENGMLYGPGVIDCKGGIAIGLLTMASLKEAGYTARPVKLIAVSDEEADERLSGNAGRDFIRENARGAAAAFTLENNSEPKYITVARKGNMRIKINVHGKFAIASVNKKEGVNAIIEAACKINEIESTAPGPEDEMIFNCGLVSGGLAEDVVPAEASFTVSVKYLRKKQRREILDHVERIVNKTHVPGATADYEILAERPAMEYTRGNRALAEFVGKISEKYGWGEMLTRQDSYGGTDAAYTSDADVPSVCALGAQGTGGHSLNENMVAASLIKRAKLMAACICDMPSDFDIR